MPKRESVGTGITERDYISYDVTGKTAGDQAAARDAFRADAKRTDEFGQWGAATDHIRQTCEAILDGTSENDEFAEDSPEQFARRILWHLKHAEAAIAQGHADFAAKLALEVGQIWATAAFKWRWEADALRGEKVAGGRKNAAHATNARHIRPREERFEVMARLAPDMGVDNAAHHCEALGLGKADAIKRQWNRHKSRDT